MKAYSTDLREKIALAYEHHDYTLDDVADLFDVGRRTVARFVQKRRAGLGLAPRPHAGGYPTALTAETLSALDIFDRLMDLYAGQAQAVLGEWDRR